MPVLSALSACWWRWPCCLSLTNTRAPATKPARVHAAGWVMLHLNAGACVAGACAVQACLFVSV
jgi:hypothetical protein